MTLLTQREAALVLRLSERTLERWRVAGIGPRFARFNHSTVVQMVWPLFGLQEKKL
jgi:hypothetical protein